MNSIQIPAFNIIGLSIRTSNDPGRAEKDIPALWATFMSKNTIANIPNIIDANIHCVYTDYEGDHTAPYTVVLGMRVSSLEMIPETMTGMSFSGGDYKSYSAAGNLEEGIVYQAWSKIWNDDINRAFTADFEVYDASKPDPSNTAVDIFIALK